MTDESTQSTDEQTGEREPSYSGRGFGYWPLIEGESRHSVEGSYGASMRVHQSSAAMAPHLWVTSHGEAHLDQAPRPHSGIPGGVARGSLGIHLDIPGVRKLRDDLGAAAWDQLAAFGEEFPWRTPAGTLARRVEEVLAEQGVAGMFGVEELLAFNDRTQHVPENDPAQGNLADELNQGVRMVPLGGSADDSQTWGMDVPYDVN